MHRLARVGPLSHTSPFFCLIKENQLLFPLLFTLQPRNGEDIFISTIPHQILALQMRIPPPLLPEKSQIILMPNNLINNNSKMSTPTSLLTRMEFPQQTDQDVGNQTKIQRADKNSGKERLNKPNKFLLQQRKTQLIFSAEGINAILSKAMQSFKTGAQGLPEVRISSAS